ncbi:hypothetical protein [Halobacillus sp. A5]|uniref:hypothetical protein n=1 Tax=Halobacillus sp. A5 TaxID=2880263 RepID=UPI0020A677E8|nr:hypothetical protein [Halobacillus sp. A5]MCP3027047.1 hypothetical protein [Halobacillus sp. A5]
MYQLNAETNQLEKIEETTFFENDLKERDHIQEWIRKSPEVLGEDLLIIGCEYDKFEINERIDLLALDKEGNVTVIELKRDITGSQVDFQALKYASYSARLSPSDLIEIYSDYITSVGIEVKAEEKLVEFLELEDEQQLHTYLNTSQRIIIVGKEIDKRILSVCTWLHENGIDVKCISIKPYKLSSEQIIIDTNQILPPFKLEDYYISKKEVKKDRQRTTDEDVVEFLQAVSDFINSKTDYVASYGGKRDYFKGHKFLDYPWAFVFAYKKKENKASMFVESTDEETVQMIQQIGEGYKSGLAEQFNAKVDFRPGVRNKSLLRLAVEIEYTDDQPLAERIDKFTNTFVKYKNFLEHTVKKDYQV